MGEGEVDIEERGGEGPRMSDSGWDLRAPVGIVPTMWISTGFTLHKQPVDTLTKH